MKDFKTYNDATYRYGLLWIWTAIAVLLAVPVIVCLVYDAWPEGTAVLKGLLGVAPIYWTVGLIEVITYTPMLGTGGTFIGFVAGNVPSLKVPAALNAMDAMEVKPGSEEAEIVSAIAIATSAIVPTIIISVGVLLFSLLTPVLESPVLKPAFDNILPALFGGLAVVFIGKSWKIAMAPLVFMVLLFIAVPSLASSVGVLVPVGSLIAIGATRLLYKKGWI
ncbi:hypothetical protein [Eubacterium aggregans]|uniref:hypothetical protein n=1 Tax=Eubacterium aggregans TaxID=81409 RepID=UPI003F3675D5